jgi:hypothetical protein
MESLQQLLQIINSGVADITRTYADAGRPFPSLDAPYGGPDALEQAAAPHVALVVAAAQQLIASVQLPAVSVSEVAYGMYRTAAFGAVMRTHVPELVREAGPQVRARR